MKDIFQVLNQRMSIRSFSDKKISDEDMSQIMLAATLGPSMNNFQPVTFIEIEDQDIKDEVTSLAGMGYIGSAARFIVVTIDYNKMFIGATEEQVELMKANLSWTNMYEGAVLSAGIASENIVLAAESLGIGAVTMAGAVRPFAFLEEALELPDFVKPVLGISLGYADMNPGVKPKLPVDGGFWMKDKYDQKNAENAVSEYNQIMSDYYQNRGVSDDWTQHNIKMLTRGVSDNSAQTEYTKSKGFAQK
ncbi:MAG: nitroreductase family protein [Lactobacillaceae bacterium]|jgi:nitroreductase|nr:nitroreductase family protein [Lactobacillaceae bacterium]